MLAAIAGGAALVIGLAALVDDTRLNVSFETHNQRDTTAQNVTFELSAATAKRYLSGTGPISARKRVRSGTRRGIGS